MFVLKTHQQKKEIIFAQTTVKFYEIQMSIILSISKSYLLRNGSGGNLKKKVFKFEIHGAKNCAKSG